MSHILHDTELSSCHVGLPLLGQLDITRYMTGMDCRKHIWDRLCEAVWESRKAHIVVDEGASHGIADIVLFPPALIQYIDACTCSRRKTCAPRAFWTVHQGTPAEIFVWQKSKQDPEALTVMECGSDGYFILLSSCTC